MAEKPDKREWEIAETITHPQCKKVSKAGIEKGEGGSGWEKEFIIDKERY